MIRQCLSNTNESAIVFILQIFLQLNKALSFFVLLFLGEAASSLDIVATYKISHVPSVPIVIWC
jgi:hypothetical protein